MTSSQADGGCPFIAGAEKRIPVTFEDSKILDDISGQTKVHYVDAIVILINLY